MDLSWLQAEARTIHGVFENAFYGIVTVLLLLAIVIEHFQLPIGGSPGFVPLVGRAFIAAFLLHAYPEISNAIADVADALALRVGDLHKVGQVTEALGDRLSMLTASWSSAKGLLLTAISYVTFYLFYLSVHIANAGVVYVWVLSYVFSPLLIAMYVIPATAGSTGALFRTLFEVSAW